MVGHEGRNFHCLNDAMALWLSLDAKVAQNEKFLDNKASTEKINANVKEMEKLGVKITCSIFQGGNPMYT